MLAKIYSEGLNKFSENCEWNEWTTSGCSKSCKENGGSAGTRTKTRSILNKRKCGGKECFGPETENELCNDIECPGENEFK